MRNNQGGYQEREGKRDENRNSQSTGPPSLFIYLTYLFIYLFIYLPLLSYGHYGVNLVQERHPI